MAMEDVLTFAKSKSCPQADMDLDDQVNKPNRDPFEVIAPGSGRASKRHRLSLEFGYSFEDYQCMASGSRRGEVSQYQGSYPMSRRVRSRIPKQS